MIMRLYAFTARFVLIISLVHIAIASVPLNKRSVGEYIEETGFHQSIRLKNVRPLYSKQSKYQTIEVHESSHYGKILVLDGVIQLTERDADAYNEMLAHVPLFQHPEPKRVLVIGGGDGYVLSEVLKHESVEHVDHVDLDEEVIETSKLFFSWGDAWKDPRVRLHVTDGAAFVRNAPADYYDVIIQDSSDPWSWDGSGGQVVLPSSVLYSRDHFENIHRILQPKGIFNMQAESIQIPSDLKGVLEWRKQALQVGFSSARYGSIVISSYPTGQIGFLMCEKGGPNLLNMKLAKKRFDRFCELGVCTTYYQPKLQASSFDLPLWAEKEIYGSDKPIDGVCDGKFSDSTSES